jgi:hypothetical protein
LPENSYRIGLVQYTNSLDEAESAARLGKNLIIIKAKKGYSSTFGYKKVTCSLRAEKGG